MLEFPLDPRAVEAAAEVIYAGHFPKAMRMNGDEIPWAELAPSNDLRQSMLRRAEAAITAFLEAAGAVVEDQRAVVAGGKSFPELARIVTAWSPVSGEER